MQARIIKPNQSSEFYFHEGCHILELLNDDNDPMVSIARARVAPGQTTHWHRLEKTSERYLIISGEGRVEAGNLPAATVAAGDLVLIPPDTAQRICCTSETELVFYAICSPRFTAACYQTIEEE